MAGSNAVAAPRVDIDVLVCQLEQRWADQDLESIPFEVLPRAMDEKVWGQARALYTAFLWTSEHDAVPVLLAYAQERIRWRGSAELLHVLFSVYDDGKVETHYLRSWDRDSEVATDPRPLARVTGGSWSERDPSLTIQEPATLGITHSVVAQPSTEAADVVRVLARRAGARRPASLAPRGQRGELPAPRLVRDAREAEELAAEWVRAMGFSDARVTPPGADGGIDIHTPESGTVAGQVKFEALKTGRPALQRLYGAGHATGASTFVFFSSAGYTPAAAAWADPVGMALFRFAIDGSVESVNRAAQDLLNV